MRALFLTLIIVVFALILAVATGFLHLNQTQEAKSPTIGLSNSGVTTTGGQAPSFQVETGSVSVGSERKDVTLPKVAVPVPTIKVNRPTDAPVPTAQPVANNAQ